jgi:hypothetical protein
MKPPSNRQFNVVWIISMLEGIGVALYMLAIPGDPKNAVLWGYSANRLLLLTAAFMVLLLLVLGGTNKSFRERVRTKIIPSPWLTKHTGGILWVTFLLLWLTVWVPPYRLAEGSAIFVRLQPLLLWLELLVFQCALLAWLAETGFNWQSIRKSATDKKRGWLLWLVLFLSVIALFGVLALTKSEFSGNQLYFPPALPYQRCRFFSFGACYLFCFEKNLAKKNILPGAFCGLCFLFCSFGV